MGGVLAQEDDAERVGDGRQQGREDARRYQGRAATSFARPRGFKPDFVALETDATVIFPWDRKVYEGEEWVVNPRYDGVIEE